MEKLSSSISGDISRDRLCSIGGGPGYDHLVIALATWFLYKAQPGRSEGELSTGTLLPKTVQTQVFGLYDQEWLPMMEQLEECFEGESESEIQSEKQDWWKQNQMTMHHGDLRRNLFDDESTSSCNDELMSTNDADRARLTSVRTADIVFQFVLHENASFLVDHETGWLQHRQVSMPL